MAAVVDPLDSSLSDGYEEDFSSDGVASEDVSDEELRAAGLWRRRAPALARFFKRPKLGIRAKIRQKRTQISAKSKRALRAAVTGDPTGTTRVRDYVKLPRAIQTIDKVSFTLGVAGLLLTQFVATEYPESFHVYYLATAPFIFAYRAWQYYTIKYHYFLIDFCYYANVLHFAQIFLSAAEGDGKTSAAFFKTTFAFANGPILWAIPLWRNSLVFHSHDKVQSVYIHCVPALLTWCARWYGQGDARRFLFSSEPVSMRESARRSFENVNRPDASFLDAFVHFFVYPTLGYLAWQIAYLLKTEFWDVRRLDEDPELVTSLRWLASDHKASATKFALKSSRAIGLFSKDELFDASSLKTKFVFVSLQLLYTVVTFLPIPLCYRYKAAHTAAMLSAFASCIWNGAEYYIDIFSRRYAKKFDEGTHGGSVRDEDDAEKLVGEGVSIGAGNSTEGDSILARDVKGKDPIGDVSRFGKRKEDATSNPSRIR